MKGGGKVVDGMKLYLGFMATELIWGLMILFCALVLLGGYQLYNYSRKEENAQKAKALYGIAMSIMIFSGIILFVLLLPIIINMFVWILGSAAVGEIIDLF